MPAMLVWDHLLRQIAPCDTCCNGFRCYTVTFTISFFFFLSGFVGFSLEEKNTSGYMQLGDSVPTCV